MGRCRVLVAALVGASVLAAAAEAQSPVVSVEPQRAIPGQHVVVTGRGFCGVPGCSRVRIQLYGAVVATGVRVSAGGTFTSRIRVPGGAPTGEVGLVATQALGDGSEVQAFSDVEMAVRLKTQQTVKPKPDAAGGAAVAPRNERSSKPSASPPAPAPSGREEAVRTEPDATGRGPDVAASVAAVAIVLVLGAAVALVIGVARTARRPRGVASKRG